MQVWSCRFFIEKWSYIFSEFNYISIPREPGSFEKAPPFQGLLKSGYKPENNTLSSDSSSCSSDFFPRLITCRKFLNKIQNIQKSFWFKTVLVSLWKLHSVSQYRSYPPELPQTFRFGSVAEFQRVRWCRFLDCLPQWVFSMWHRNGTILFQLSA